jgi:hypothetical protein
MSEIDKTNIDAAYWASEFCKVSPDTDEGLILGWFANYRLAVADPLQAKVEELEAYLATYKEDPRNYFQQVELDRADEYAKRVVLEIENGQLESKVKELERELQILGLADELVIKAETPRCPICGGLANKS